MARSKKPKQVFQGHSKKNTNHLQTAQKELAKKLQEVDSKLETMYLGALETLSGNSRDKVAQAAHSIRELVMALSNKGKPFVKGKTVKKKLSAKEEKTNNARQLEAFIDLLGGVKALEGETIYEEWNKEHQKFIDIAHHKIEISEESFLKLLNDYENFLLNVVLPEQVEIYQRIDVLIKKGPAACIKADLMHLITRNFESYRYFFRSIDEVWVDFLVMNGLVSEKGLKTDSVVTDYLTKIAEKEPKKVLKILEPIKLKSSAYFVRHNLVGSLKHFESGDRKKLLQKMKRDGWFSGSVLKNDSYMFITLVEELIVLKDFKNALYVLKSILEIDKEASTATFHSMTGKLEDYECESALESILKVPVEESEPFIRLERDILYAGIEEQGKFDNDEDGSVGWRQAIEPSVQNWHFPDTGSLLVTSLVQSLEAYLESKLKKGSDIPKLIQKLLPSEKYKTTVFKRLRIHLFRRFKENCLAEVNETIVSQFYEDSLFHEYMLLAKEAFPLLTAITRKQFMERIKSGPKRNKKDAQYREWWKVRRYKIIEQYLEGKFLKEFNSLSKTKKMDEESALYFVTHHSSSGFPSEKNAEEIGLMGLDNLLDFLAERNLSEEKTGLGMELRTAVSKDITTFSANLDKIAQKSLHPTFLYNIISGISEGAKEETQQINWNEVIPFLLHVSRKALLVGEEIDPKEFSLNEVLKTCLWLLQKGLRPKIGIPISKQQDVFEIMENARKAVGSGKVEGTEIAKLHHESVNTLEGISIFTLYDYIFWSDKNKNSKSERITSEAKEMIKNSLENTRINTLERFVHGQFFAWVVVYDKQFAEEIQSTLFPDTNTPEWHSAWSGYVTAGEKTIQGYNSLQPQYKQSIRDLDNKKITDSHEEIFKSLGYSIAGAFIGGLEGGQLLLEAFFTKAKPKLKAEVVSFIGRTFVGKGEELETAHIEPLKWFWNWRLENADTTELAYFGDWVEPNKFDDDWLLNQLNSTLEKTKGHIEYDFGVINALTKLVTKHPAKVLESLLLICKSRDSRILYHKKQIEEILTIALGKRSKKVKDKAKKIINHLTQLGFTEYKVLLEGGESDPTD